ncbi:MAG: AAA family ATPase, partial [Acidobacteria bacterium]|nr:AAA family ATPase [Acidobacteriota bacterium]
MVLKEFGGTDRFVLRRKLGAGTAGEVFEAWDRETEHLVALKVLQRLDAAAIYRFKKEFRALADIDHRNLVQLYELLFDGEWWFYSMERVHGRSFLDHVRDRAPATDGARGDGEDTPTFISPLVSRVSPPRRSQEPKAEQALPSPPCRLDLLRPALTQLASGLDALHEAGKLHCDIKPSNVLVTEEGRVVLLDFGLVRDLLGPWIDHSLDRDIVGTPAYMSPEQASGLETTAASDWYSVGTMLYESLSGRLPFSGNVMKVLMDKQRKEPPPLDGDDGSLPQDLRELCQALLQRDPRLRPSGREVLRWIGGSSGSAVVPRKASPGLASSTSALPFVGREEALRALEKAQEDSRQGRTVAVFIHGAAGVGKTVLMRRFLQDLRLEDESAVVLTGRCFQREAVPYKAFDSLVDSLSRHLRSLPDAEAEALMPYNVLALARLFPVLQRVRAVAGARRRVLQIPDSGELRRRAFTALRELFQRMAERRSLVLAIDDLHWGDLDSAALLHEVLRPPDPPPLLLVACFRSEEAMSSPLLSSLFSSELTKAATEVRELQLRELQPGEAEEMARKLLGEKAPEGNPALARAIAHESAGNPLFVETLVRYVQALATAEDPTESRLADFLHEATLDKVVEARLERLPEGARTLLELVAIAGQPLTLETARYATGLLTETPAALAALRAAQLIRVRVGRGEERLEAYHERIREAIVQRMTTGHRRGLHQRLAQAMVASGKADPEALAVHFREAGDAERAAARLEGIEHHAAQALAFDRAASLYRLALDQRGEGPEIRPLLVRLGDALRNAGRGAEAAQAYLSAADGASRTLAVDLRRKAAEQLLISGRIDKGLATIRHVLASIGLKLPGAPRQALLSLLWRRARLRLRGLRHGKRSADQVPADELLYIDTCWSVSVGLGLVDILRGMDFGTRALLSSLASGEPYRIARALAMEVGYSATAGSKARRKTRELIGQARTLARQVEEPHALGLADLTAGIAAYLQGSWASSLEQLDGAEAILRERCTGVTWELDTVFIFQLRALLMLGRLKEVQRRFPGLLKEVRERGDLYAETNLASRMAWVVGLAEDAPLPAEERLENAIRRWSQQGFHLQHYWHMTGRAEIALYRGEPAEAWERLEQLWPGLASSLLLRIQFTRVEAYHLRA